MKTQYIFHTDPGHGWLAVKYAELIRLGIREQISGGSYISESGKTVYLEEDCDMTIFMNAKKSAGEICNLKESYQEYTPIRNFRLFNGWH